MMNENYTCPKCGRKFSKYSIKNHLRWHEENPDRLYPQYTPPEDLHCPYCGSLRPDFRSWSQHKRRCPQNPEIIDKNLKVYISKQSVEISSEIHRFDPEIFTCQYCGTSTTTQKTPFKSCQSCKTHESVCRYNPKNILIHPDYVSDLEKELDDDGKLFIKWSQKRSNAKTMGNECFLSFDDFCHLVKDAGLVSSQLGINGEGYDLARYEDKGPYESGNCRFITHAENNREKPSYVAIRESRRKEELLRQQEREARVQSRLERAVNAKPKDSRYSNEHNSSWGSHWITNGIESRKWRPWKEEIPEGWRLGRIITRLHGGIT